MLQLYKDFIINSEAKRYSKLKNINKYIFSFIDNVHTCRYAMNQLLTKSKTHFN